MRGRTLELAVKQRNAVVGDIHKAPNIHPYPLILLKPHKKSTKKVIRKKKDPVSSVRVSCLPVKQRKEFITDLQETSGSDGSNCLPVKRPKELTGEIQETSSGDQISCLRVKRRKELTKEIIQESSSGDRSSFLPEKSHEELRRDVQETLSGDEISCFSVKRRKELTEEIEDTSRGDRISLPAHQRKELTREIQETSCGDRISCLAVKQHKDLIMKKQETPADKISCFPDSVLLHILSFLDMHDVTRTSLLSKRWRYLWTSITYLDFCFDDSRKLKTDVLTFIDKSIINHEGSKVHRLCIGNVFREKSCSSLDIDSWIRFAIRRNVEELVLDFFDEDTPASKWYDVPYKLPRSLYKCRSLTDLKVSFCGINLPTSANLSSLKRLTLEVVYLSINAIKNLTSSCPVLEELILGDCNCFEDLHIVIENQNVKSLEICDAEVTNANSEMMIYAPHVVSLYVRRRLRRGKYCLINLQSVVKARFYEPESEANPLDEYHWADGYQIASLLGDLFNLKELNLCHAYVQVLSACGIYNGTSIPINATHIQIDSNLTKWDLPGISHLLRNSCKLENLTIKPATGKPRRLANFIVVSFDFEEKGFWKHDEFDFLSAMQNLKIVDLHLWSGADGEREVDEILGDLENKCEFVEFILKNSTRLERMTLSIGKNNKSAGKNYETLFELAKKLIVLPRASTRAEIHFI